MSNFCCNEIDNRDLLCKGIKKEEMCSFLKELDSKETQLSSIPIEYISLNQLKAVINNLYNKVRKIDHKIRRHESLCTYVIGIFGWENKYSNLDSSEIDLPQLKIAKKHFQAAIKKYEYFSTPEILVKFKKEKAAARQMKIQKKWLDYEEGVKRRKLAASQEPFFTRLFKDMPKIDYIHNYTVRSSYTDTNGLTAYRGQTIPVIVYKVT